MRRHVVVAIVICLVAGFVVQAIVACVLALRSRVGQPGFDTGVLLSFYRNPANERTSWPSPSDYDYLAMAASGARSEKLGHESAPTNRGRVEAAALRAAFDMWPWLTTDTAKYQQFSIQYWQGFGVAMASGFADDGVWGVDDPDEIRTWSQRYTSGWPMRSMQASVDRSGAIHGGVLAPATWLAADRQEMFVHWDQPPIQPVIPLRPILIATAVNTLVFSAPFLIVPGVIWLRRAVRRRAGRCPHCGYNRAGIARGTPCPECGRP